MKTPDFAFPKKVSNQSLATLKQAVASGNGPVIVRSILDYTLAQSSIGEDKIPASLELIDKTLGQSSQPETKAMLYLVKATILSDIYDNDQYTFNERNLPLLPMPSDYTEWSGKQFQYAISQLCDSVMTHSDALKRISIKDYYQIVEHDSQTPVYFPTLYDFAAYRTIALRSKLTDIANLFALAFLSPARTFIIEPHFVPMSGEATKILDLYAELLKFHSNNAAPYIFADIQRLDFVHNGMYNTLDHGETTNTLRTSLEDLYNQQSDNEFSGDVLIKLSELINYTGSDQQKIWLYNKAKHNLATFPSFSRNDCLKNIITRLSAKSVNINHDASLYPGQEFDVHINNTNTSELTVSLYRLPDGFTSKSVYNGAISGLKLIERKDIKSNGVVPFSESVTAKFTAPEPGYYIVATESKEITTNNRRNGNYRIAHCSTLATGSFSLDSVTVYVVNPMTGAPVADANIMMPTKGNSLTKIGQTNREGLYGFHADKYSTLYAQKGNDIYAQSLYTGYSPRNAIGIDSAVNAFTDLPLYHPGDIVKFSAIAYSIEGNHHQVLSSRSISANLFDANNQFVDSLIVVSDEFGRVNGEFKLPENGLTGQYHIAFGFGEQKLKNYWSKRAGQANIMVSDYKLPTFEVIADKPLTDTPEKGSVTLKGSVKTFSGMPLGNQEVNIKVSVAQGYWWRMSNEVAFYSESVTTAPDGSWQLVLSKETLDYSPAPYGYFIATVSSTSPSGESQQTSVSFTRGVKYMINAAINGDIDLSCPVNLNLRVSNSADETIDLPVHYRLLQNDSTIMDGIVKPDLDWTHLEVGEYNLELYLPQDSSTQTTRSVVLYSPTGNTSPVHTPIWMPETEKPIIAEEGSATLLYGTYSDTTHILYTLSTPFRIIEQKWIEAPRGMHNLTITLPKDVESADLNIQATVNMRCNQYQRTIVRKSSIKSLKLKTESFRDKLIPGATETWTFRTTDINDQGEQTAMVLSMYNAALSSLQAPEWSLSPRMGFMRKLYMNTPALEGSCFHEIDNDLHILNCRYLSIPVFNLYDRSFINSRMFLYESIRPTAKMTLRSGAVVNEMKEDAMLDNAVTTGYGVAESVEEEEASINADGGGSNNAGREKSEFEYRDNNVVGGLWMPDITTQEDGTISVSFTVPNANTTWQLFVSAFNKELINTTLTKELVANKPVMVQPNLPRYLRTGDRAVLNSLVMNNSDSTANITTIVEIFNPATNETIATYQYENLVLPGQNATVSTEVTAPMNRPMIGFRIKASTTEFADGEQSVLPILPASQPVIDTKTFYIAPDSTQFSINLPEMPKDANITLQYCENPLWYIVTALPGLAENQPTTAIDAAYNIFSAAVAKGILKENPSIAQALKYWSSAECSDSTLVSMLERNPDLKTVWLNATPWLSDAKSDTERMTRLALLLNNNNIDNTIQEGIKYLKKVSRQNGGFAWTNQCDEPSLWATSEVLACLGRVNQLGFMPDIRELRSMVNAALGYLQKETEKNYAKYPKSDYFGYVAILDQWPDFKRSTLSNTITATTVQRTVKKWRNYSVGHKAEAVELLVNHNYNSVARTILSSLREYSEYNPQQGMWWPSVGDMYGGSMAQLQVTANALEAFHAAEPLSMDIDRIRQWLILQKEAENWGTSAFTTDVISSILLTSKSWLQPSTPAVIAINGRDLALPEADKYTGYLRTNISDSNPSGAILSISRKGSSPAFGAIFCQYTQDMANIQPQSCDAVNIEKRVLKHQGTGTVASDTLAVGDKVQVTLTIHVARDMQYVAITDNRPACFEPVEQLPAPIYSDGICFYRENRDSATNLFVTNLPKGTYQLTYDMWVNNAGQFASGVATLQSQYAPQLSAHSGGNILKITE